MRDLKLPQDRHPEKAHKPDNRQSKKPDWIRVKAPVSEGYKATRDIMREHNLVTVCEEAGCPNVGECWSQGHATMMIMGSAAWCRRRGGASVVLNTCVVDRRCGAEHARAGPIT